MWFGDGVGVIYTYLKEASNERKSAGSWDAFDSCLVSEVFVVEEIKNE